jgi:mycothiol synthase
MNLPTFDKQLFYEYDHRIGIITEDDQPMGLTIRMFQFDDLPAVVDVINRAAQADHEDTRTTPDDLRTRFERPYFYAEQNCLVAERPDGTLIGYITAELDPRVGRGWGTGGVHPDHRRQGIGRALLQAADARHHERAATELAPDLPLWVTRFCRDTNASTRALLEAEQYAIWRVSWFMHIDLAEATESPALPQGFTLRPFERERDARAIWAVEKAIFDGAPGYVQPPFEVWETFMFPPGHDDRLWLVAMQDDDVAGVCLCHPKHDRPATGWVELFGVQTAYRRRGLGSALLRRSFDVMRAHGFTAAELDVDSENTSNAVALYEGAGMRVDRKYLIYRKVLRGAVDD